MANTNLTKMLLAGLVITFVVGIFIAQYANFAVMNNSTIQEPYKGIFYNISSKYTDFSKVGNTVGNKHLVTNILDFGKTAITGTVNVFVTGLSAIGTFFDMIPLFGGILSAIAFGIPQLSGLIGLLTLFVTILVAMYYIKSVSNKQDLP